MKKEDIVKATCDYYKITPEYLFEKKRERERVLKRQICIYLLLMDSVGTLMECEFFIKKEYSQDYHHATLLHSKNIIDSQKNHYTEIQKDINKIRNLYPKKDLEHFNFQNSTRSGLNYNYQK